MTHPELFKPWFPEASWQVGFVIAKVLSGVALNEGERAIYRQISNRDTVPTDVRQLWIMAGRRSGKSLFSAFLGIYHALMLRATFHRRQWTLA